MSVIVANGVLLDWGDWQIALVCVLFGYCILYPLIIIATRRKHTYRIKHQLVTTAYRLPVSLTPAELAYLFSTHVKNNILYATLLDMNNKSIIRMHKKDSKTYVEMGPKVDSHLGNHEKLLLNYIEKHDQQVDVKEIIQGDTNYRTHNGEGVKGSRQYVFWWLLRDMMRRKKLIKTSMTRIYVIMLLQFGLTFSLLLAVIPLLMVRIFSMLQIGKIDIAELMMYLRNGLFFWIIFIIPSIILSFILIRFRGRMLGRYWLLTPQYLRYLEQFEAYREFVRLTHRNKLRFENAALKKESLLATKPYAVALGYSKE